jgi:predicted esterase
MIISKIGKQKSNIKMKSAFISVLIALSLIQCTKPATVQLKQNYSTVTDATILDSAEIEGAVSPLLHRMTWTIEGVTREALVYVPIGDSLPILFAFHGHGGTDTGFSHKAFEKYWPNAIIVYPQGLRTKSGSDKYGNGTGWQHSVGEINNHTGIQDQDLKFFDAMVSTFSSSINHQLIFVHGWSNGGEFAYDVLWTARGNELQAIAPASAILNTTAGKNQMPVMQISGINDPVVSFTLQQKYFQPITSLDDCYSSYTWCESTGILGTKYRSQVLKPAIFVQYDGGHSYPDSIPGLIAKFFKDRAAKL